MEKQGQKESFEPLGENENNSDQKSEHAKEKNIGMAVVAYILFFVPLLTDAKDDPFVKYHVHQGFVLFVTAVAVSVIYYLPMFMLIGMIMQLGVIVLAVIGIMNAVNGKKEPLPVIGQFADKVTF